jgi:adenylate kinase
MSSPAGKSVGLRLVLLGPPGVGKGTQAGNIAKEYALPHISTGDMFRAAIAQGTAAGKAAKKYLDSGGLVPDGVVTDMVRERLGQADAKAGFLLDGFPRTGAQAESLDAMLKERGEALTAVIHFTAPESVIVDRLSGRRLCRKCGAGYHVRYMLPKREGVCDKCGGELYQREDDRAEAILNRLKVYKAQTAELGDYYRARGVLRDVAAEAEVEAVAAAVRSVLQPLAGIRRNV